MLTRRNFFLAMASLPTLAAASPEHWPQFRGPGSRGVSGDDPSLPDSWSDSENVMWRSEVPGLGWSSPVVWGDRVFLTSVISSNPIEAPTKGLYFGGNRPEPPQGLASLDGLLLRL